MSDTLLTPELNKQLLEEGYYLLMIKPGRGICGLKRFAFTTALCYGLDEHGYIGRYCYEYGWTAIKAMHDWDGKGDPPENWIKHKARGNEYSNPDYEQ